MRKFADQRDKQQAKPLANGKLPTAERNVCAYAGLSLHCAAPHGEVVLSWEHPPTDHAADVKSEKRICERECRVQEELMAVRKWGAL